VVARDGIEPPTPAFSGLRSTDWATWPFRQKTQFSKPPFSLPNQSQDLDRSNIDYEKLQAQNSAFRSRFHPSLRRHALENLLNEAA
jgi:hypothetical protein